VCQAVRAPGVKWTHAAPIRDPSDGEATVSMKTDPVNQSLGPRFVSRLFRVICIVLPVSSFGAVALPETAGHSWVTMSPRRAGC
jgi:hypothetical protein